MKARVRSQLLGEIKRKGSKLTYTQLGSVKTIHSKGHGCSREIATSLNDNTGRIWHDLLLEAAREDM